MIGICLQVHLILRHKKPNGDIEEKHLDAPPAVNLDKLTHVYTAIIDTDNRYSHLSNILSAAVMQPVQPSIQYCADAIYSYQILIDGEEKKSGSIFEDFTPSINPPTEIDDPEDTKPEDWVDTPKYANPTSLHSTYHWLRHPVQSSALPVHLMTSHGLQAQMLTVAMLNQIGCTACNLLGTHLALLRCGRRLMFA